MRWSWRGARDTAVAAGLVVSLYLNMAQAARAEALAEKLREIRENCIVFDAKDVAPELKRDFVDWLKRATESPATPR